MQDEEELDRAQEGVTKQLEIQEPEQAQDETTKQ